jgi:hypothetical protein
VIEDFHYLHITHLLLDQCYDAASVVTFRHCNAMMYINDFEIRNSRSIAGAVLLQAVHSTFNDITIDNCHARSGAAMAITERSNALYVVHGVAQCMHVMAERMSAC